MAAIINAGARAPNFELPATTGGTTSLADLAGAPFVLVFYPGDFTPVCSSELALFQQALETIEGYGARLLGVSVDSLASHGAFAKAQGLTFPLLSDAHPKGAMSKAFGSYNDERGVSERSLFVVDAEGVVAWSYLSPMGVNPGVDGVLEALSHLAGTASKAASTPTREDFHFRGDPNSPVTLMEFGDYQCPYCGQAYFQVERVLTHFGNKLRFEFRNFPLASVHPYAVMAAEAAEAAGAQGKFWDMHDALYEHQSALSPDMVVQLARQLGLDLDRFVNDVNGNAYVQRIRGDLQDGLRAGVNGTPSFFINGRKYDGSFDASSLIRAIEAAGLRA